MPRIKSWDEIGFQILINLFLLAVLAVIVIPLWQVLIISLTPIAVANRQGYSLFLPPWQWTVEAYRQFISQPTFLRALNNSLVITLGGTALSLALTVPLAYALSIRTLPGRNFFVGFILLTFLFHTGLVPVYLVVTGLKLHNTLWAILVPYSVSVYNTLVMKSFFEGLPEEIIDAARIDGANDLGVLVHVVLPLSRPILMTIGLFYAVVYWNEFFHPILYLSDPDLMPLPVLLRNILSGASVNESVDYNAFSSATIESLRAAGVLLTSLPMFLAYPWIQKYFTRGTLLGAVNK